ncbi:MAG: hypothetical protein ACFB10_14065 [Salibacteraceae bacterium]
MLLLLACEKERLEPKPEANQGALYLEASIDGETIRMVPGQESVVGETFYSPTTGVPNYWSFQMEQRLDNGQRKTLEISLGKNLTYQENDQLSSLRAIVQPGEIMDYVITGPQPLPIDVVTVQYLTPDGTFYTSSGFPLQSSFALTIEKVREVVYGGKIYIEAQASFSGLLVAQNAVNDSVEITNGSGLLTFGGIYPSR